MSGTNVLKNNRSTSSKKSTSAKKHVESKKQRRQMVSKESRLRTGSRSSLELNACPSHLRHRRVDALEENICEYDSTSSEQMLSVMEVDVKA